MDKPRIAIIAIHGVGDHKAGATSAAIAEQLQYFGHGEFGAFECTPLQITVDANELRAPAAAGVPNADTSVVLPKGVAARGRAAKSDGEGTDIAFTAITLAGGSEYADSYSTTRMRSSKPGAEGLDLYEMFWSDLSHGGTSGGLTALRQMLQLFLHVASLGRTALSTLLAAHEHQAPNRALSFVYGLSAWGYWLLAVPIALGNLFMLCLGAALLAFLVPNTEPGRIGTIIAGTILAATVVGGCFKWLLRLEPLPLLLQRKGLRLILWATLAISLLGIRLWKEAWVVPMPLAFVLALVVSLGLGSVLAWLYGISRPGARTIWCVLLGATILWGIRAWLQVRGHKNAALDCLALLIDGNFFFLTIACVVLAAVNLLLLVAGLYTRFRFPGEVRRAVDTSLIAAAVPAPLLLVMVLTLWSAFWHMLNASDYARQTLMAMSITPLPGDAALTVSQRMEQLINLSASPAAMPFLLCMTLALTCAVVAFVPSIVAELIPASHPDNLASSRGLWRWLDQGFGLLQGSKWIAVIAFFCLLPAGLYLANSGSNAGSIGLRFPNLRFSDPGVFSALNLNFPSLGVIFGGSAFGFLALTRLLRATSLGNLSKAAARTRVVVDTAIDVDNWLRERPVGRTPRLRIMARYVSLLRYLREQRYERIVVVSHSQGTVITLDLLRYFKARNPDFLRQLAPIDLLTFGSPLRQLYAQRFPGLYGWAENADCTKAGLASWRNGYGSGDYVGRNLWSAGHTEPWQPGYVNDWEFCTGALAHTHYFDEHSPEVAAAIIDTIARSPGQRRAVA